MAKPLSFQVTDELIRDGLSCQRYIGKMVMDHVAQHLKEAARKVPVGTQLNVVIELQTKVMKPIEVT